MAHRVPDRSLFQLPGLYAEARVFALSVVRLPLGQVWKWASAEVVVFWIFAGFLLVAMLRFLDPYVHTLSQLEYQFSIL